MINKRKNFLQQIKKEWSAYIFILPSVLMFFGLVGYPMVLSFIYSLQDRGLVNWSWIGLQNYKDILTDVFFLGAIRNTVTIVIILVPIVVLITFIIAMQVTPMNKAFRSYFRVVFYLPVVTSGVVVSMVWLWIFDPNFGLLNHLITSFGFEPVVWLSSSYSLYFIILVIFTFNFGVPFIVYGAAIGNIPKTLIEVASLDGAKKRTITWKIVFPLLKPVTFFVLVTQTIGVFMVFVVVQLLTDGGPVRSTETIIFMLYRTAFRFLEFGRASAMGMVLFAMVLLVAILQKIFVGNRNDY